MAEYVVHERTATLNEYNVAMALDRLKLQYYFQYAPFGFSGLRGQYIVDFLVFTPLEQPLEVYGNYWHTGQLGADDKLRLAILERHFRRPVIVLWGTETETKEEALEAVRREVGGVL
jgi:hypothetical protein